MTPQSIERLMADIEAEDLLDVGALSLDGEAARHLMACHFCELDRQLSEHGLDAAARLDVMAAIAAHTMAENLVLHVQRLRAADSNEAFRAWMRRYGIQ